MFVKTLKSGWDCLARSPSTQGTLCITCPAARHGKIADIWLMFDWWMLRAGMIACTEHDDYNMRLRSYDRGMWLGSMLLCFNTAAEMVLVDEIDK